MAVPHTKTALKAMLLARGRRPTRHRGQHFLVDPNLVDAIVRSAGVRRDDCVLEVGTGSGILTDKLIGPAGCVVSLEIDRELLELTRQARDWPTHAILLEADVLRRKHQLEPAALERWRAERDARGLGSLLVVSNLPYSVATPFLANLLWEGIEARDVVVLVQREAAERFVAVPDTAAYGPMSVAVALLAEARILRRVPPDVFWPAPKVEAAVLRLTPRDPALARELRAAGLQDLLRTGFAHRRKTLRKAFSPESLERAGLDPGVRPAAVEPEGWVRLLRAGP